MGLGYFYELDLDQYPKRTGRSRKVLLRSNKIRSKIRDNLDVAESTCLTTKVFGLPSRKIYLISLPRRYWCWFFQPTKHSSSDICVRVDILFISYMPYFPFSVFISFFSACRGRCLISVGGSAVERSPLAPPYTCKPTQSVDHLSTALRRRRRRRRR